jgi:hypothetical protein
MRDEEGAILMEIEELLLLLKRRWFVVWLTYKLVAWNLDGGARGVDVRWSRNQVAQPNINLRQNLQELHKVFNSFNIMPSCT